MENISEIKSVHFAGKDRPINLMGPIQLDGYSIRPFTFLDQSKEIASGAFFELEPLAYTAVALVTEPKVKLVEQIVKGSGWFLDLDPEGNLVQRILDDKKPLTLKYGTGHTFLFVAGAEGLVIQNITTPPFRPDMEKIIEENSKELPLIFWQARAKLISPLTQQASRQPTQK